MSNRLASNTIINIAYTAISFVIAYAMTPIILHRLGVEQYGIWAFLSIFSVSGYFSLLDFGFQGAAIKYIAEYRARGDEISLAEVINATITFFISVGAIGGLLLWVFNVIALPHVFQLPADQIPHIQTLVSIVALSFLVQFPALGFAAVLEGTQRYDILRGISLAVTILTNAAILIWMHGDQSLAFLVWAIVGGGVLTVMGYVLAAHSLLPAIRLRFFSFDRNSWQKLFTLSSKLFISKIIGLVFNNTDKILIGIFLYVAVQTDYDIVNKLHIILLSILSIMNQAVLPAAAAAEARGDSAGLRTLLLRGTKYSAALVLPIWLFMLFLPRQTLTMWVGASFAPLAPLVLLYISHMFLTMLVGVSSTMLVSINKVGRVLKISLWAAIINLAVSIATVQWLGITGLILGTALAYFISSLIYIFSVNRIFSISGQDFFRLTIRPLLPSSLLTIILLLLVKLYFHNISLLVGLSCIIASYLVFFATLFRFGLDREEHQRVRDWRLLIRKPA